MPVLQKFRLPAETRAMEELLKAIEENECEAIPSHISSVCINGGVIDEKTKQLAVQKVNESQDSDLIKKTEDVLSMFPTQVR